MTPIGTDETSWASGLGARLRVLQASFADDPPATRQDYLKEELDRALRDIPANRRRGFLEALAERFPTVGGMEADPLTPVPAPAAEAAPDDAASLATRLVKAAADLSTEDRQSLARQLAQFGLAVEVRTPGAPAESGGAVPPELQKKLGLGADQTLDRERVLRLIGVLIDMVVAMDHLAWSLWKQLAPNSLVRRAATADLRRMAGPYLIGDSEVNTTNITQTLDQTRQLIGGLLAAIGASGEAFARGYLARFSPESIKDQADAEPGFFVGPEQKCWRKYIELFNETSGTVVENEITAAVVKYAEELMLGTGRGGQSHAGER